MSTEPITFEVHDDSDIIRYVRLVTGYDDNANELLESELRGHIGMMKGRLATEYGLSISNEPWFTDDGLALALVYATSIHSKITVENYSVERWDFGDEQIWTHSDTESNQLNLWMQWMNDGLDNSDTIDGGTAEPQISADYNFHY